MEALKVNQFVTVLKMNNNFTSLKKLDDLQESKETLMVINSTYLSKMNINKDDYKLESRWNKNNNENYALNLRDGENNTSIKFTIWNAIIEHRKRKIYNQTRTGLLPKDQRTDEYNVPVVFYEYDDSVYVCIVTRQDNQLKKVQELINFNNIDVAVNPLSTTGNIIEWLFWRYMSKKLTLANDDTTLLNLLSFEGTILDGDTSDLLKGRSPQISNLDVTKAILALGDPLNSAMIKLNWKNSELQFTYSISGSVSVDSNSLDLSDEIVKDVSSEEMKSYTALVYITSTVLPKLIELSTEEAQEFSEGFETFKQKLATEVIEKLIKKNNLEEVYSS